MRCNAPRNATKKLQSSIRSWLPVEAPPKSIAADYGSAFHISIQVTHEHRHYAACKRTPQPAVKLSASNSFLKSPRPALSPECIEYASGKQSIALVLPRHRRWPASGLQPTALQISEILLPGLRGDTRPAASGVVVVGRARSGWSFTVHHHTMQPLPLALVPV